MLLVLHIRFFVTLDVRHIFSQCNYFTSFPWYTIVLFFLQMSRLLGLLVLTSLCSAMLPQNSLSSEEDNSSTDPNSYNLGSAEGFNETSGEFPPWEPFNGPRPLQGKGNDTKGFNRLRAGDGDILNPIPDMTICQTLMNAPIPPPIDQIPFFCLCPQCKGTVGPKGDRGDRGPPGM